MFYEDTEEGWSTGTLIGIMPSKSVEHQYAVTIAFTDGTLLVIHVDHEGNIDTIDEDGKVTNLHIRHFVVLTHGCHPPVGAKRKHDDKGPGPANLKPLIPKKIGGGVHSTKRGRC